MPGGATRKHLEHARASLKHKRRQDAARELEAVDESELSAEVDLDLAGTARRIDRALDALKRGDLTDARQMMKASEALVTLKVRPADDNGTRKVEIVLGPVGTKKSDETTGASKKTDAKVSHKHARATPHRSKHHG